MKKNISFSRIIFIAGVFALLVLYIILWGQMISDPAQKKGTDFIALYTAGRVANKYGTHSVYDLELQKTVQEEILGFSIYNAEPLLYNHMPFLLPILMVLGKIPYSDAFFLWGALLITFYWIGFRLLQREVKSSSLMISASLFFPIFTSVLLGQDTAIFFLGVVVLLTGFQKQNNWLAGSGLALMTVRPQLALPLIGAVLFNKKKNFFQLVGFSLLLATGSILMLGASGIKDFAQILLISGKGQWFGMNEASMLNLAGGLRRAFDALDLQIIHQVIWITYIANTLFAVTWGLKSKNLTDVQFYMILTLSLFASPHLHYHDLSVLVLPLSTFVSNKHFSLNKKTQPVILLGITFLMLFTQATLVYYWLPYLLMLLIITLSIKEIRQENSSNPHTKQRGKS